MVRIPRKEYERRRAECIKEIMAVIDAIPSDPPKLIVDRELYQNLDEEHREWRSRLEPKGFKHPLDQLPEYLRVPPTEGAIYIPNYRRSTLNFGIALTAEEIILCALRLGLSIKPISKDKESYITGSTLASVRRAGYQIAQYITKVCNHFIDFKYAAGMDGMFVFALYSNFDHGHRELLEVDEEELLDMMLKILGTEKPAKWYYEGYLD